MIKSHRRIHNRFRTQTDLDDLALVLRMMVVDCKTHKDCIPTVSTNKNTPRNTAKLKLPLRVHKNLYDFDHLDPVELSISFNPEILVKYNNTLF